MEDKEVVKHIEHDRTIMDHDVLLEPTHAKCVGTSGYSFGPVEPVEQAELTQLTELKFNRVNWAHSANRVHWFWKNQVHPNPWAQPGQVNQTNQLGQVLFIATH